MQKQTNFIKTQVRLPPELHQQLVDFADEFDYSLNSAMIELLKKALENKVDTNNEAAKTISRNSGRSIYFNDLNCVAETKNESMHERTARVEQMISNLFYRNPQFELINIETLNNGEKIRYWYSIPRSESFRD